MDYEKMYKEALEKARKKHDSKYHPDMGPGGVYLNNADLEEIFPQLKESEDERILDTVIEHFKGFSPIKVFGDFDFRSEQILAYLERQKESLHILEMCKENANSFTDEDERMRKAALEGIKYLECKLDWDAIGDTDILDVKEYLEKQKEQSFTHHEIDESLRDAVTHQMEDDGDVNSFVCRGIDDIVLRYATLGAEWQKKQKPLSTEETELNSIAFLEQMGYTCIPPEKEQKSVDKCDGCNNVKGCVTCVDESEWAHYAEAEQKPAEQNTREQIISKVTTERQVVLISESNDHTEINWDTRSLEDTKALLECGLTFINKQLGINSSELIIKPKDCKPTEWSDSFEENIRNLLHDKLVWHNDDESMLSAVFIDDKTLKDIISGIWFYIGKEALKYPNKELNVAEWSEKDKSFYDSIMCEVVKEGMIPTPAQINWLKSLPEKFNQGYSEDYREEDVQTRFAFYTYKDEPSVLYLSNIFVEEASRNHGFGTRILKAAEKVAEAIGAITICLKVKQDSPANVWYRKHGYGYVAFEDGYDWLEKNLEYLKPAKSAEWSEYDEKMRWNIISVVGESKSVQAEEMMDWLKSLRPQLHWKPSE